MSTDTTIADDPETGSTIVPIQIHIDPTLAHLTVPLSTYLTSNPPYTNLVVSTLIFSNTSSSTGTNGSSGTTNTSGPKVLLIQRASTERGFPNKWEIPGGSAEPTDPTILHSAARETFEETGLHLTRLVHQVGGGSDFDIGDQRWMKLYFEIEVAEMGDMAHDHKTLGAGDFVRNDENAGKGIRYCAQGSTDASYANLPITLDPSEHQAYAWATEADIRSEKYPMTTHELEYLLVIAFALKRYTTKERERAEDTMTEHLGGSCNLKEFYLNNVATSRAI